MSEHSHAVNAAVTGLSALPGSASAFSAARAMSRFLNHDGIPFHALIEPAQDAVRSELAQQSSPFALIVHDWCMFNFNQHTSKCDRYVRSHDTDLGYELGTAWPFVLALAVLWGRWSFASVLLAACFRPGSAQRLSRQGMSTNWTRP